MIVIACEGFLNLKEELLGFPWLIQKFINVSFVNGFFNGGKIRISFTETGQGLTISDKGSLKGFAVAGSDKKFYWAKAVIDGNSVIVSSDEVKSPVAVRYAWADNPDCNLINKDGLPAIPFRTDF